MQTFYASLVCQNIYLSIYLSIAIYLFSQLFIYLFSYLPIYLSIYLVRLSIYLSIYLARLSIYLSIYLARLSGLNCTCPYSFCFEPGLCNISTVECIQGFVKKQETCIYVYKYEIAATIYIHI